MDTRRAQTPKSRDVDVAVVGAGAAGIAAARRLRAAGASVRLLEAAARIGGRAHTDDAALGVAFDRGAAWLHCASRNPFRAYADALGFRYAGDPAMRYHAGGRWLSGDAAAEVEATWRGANEALRAAGAGGADVAAATLLDARAPHAAIRDYLLTAIRAVAPADYATAEAAAEEDTHEDWVVIDGLGALVERLGRDLPVATAAPVRRIAHGRRGVRLGTGAGTVCAAAAIVTVSTGVLAGDAIAFDPPLAEARRAALVAVPMGRAEKVALRFAPDPFSRAANTFMTIERDGVAMGFHFLAGADVLVVGYAGADQAEAIARGDDAAVVDRALGFLEHAFGGGVRERLVAATRTAWLDDPDVRGAYSAARPGGHARRADLAAPAGDRLFFAGEATHPTQFASVHGAWRSGERAAGEALTAIGRGAARADT